MEDITIEFPFGGHLSDRQRGTIMFKDARVLHINAPAVRINGQVEFAAKSPDPSVQERATAWDAVCKTLDEVAPGWIKRAPSGLNAAVLAIRRLGTPAVQAKPEPIPFDLEAAKAGAPVLWGSSGPVRWVGRTDRNVQTAAYNIIENGYGLAYAPDRDLFMAPKPKRTRWLNLSRAQADKNAPCSAVHYPTKAEAEASADMDPPAVWALIAHPIEIDA